MEEEVSKRRKGMLVFEPTCMSDKPGSHFTFRAKQHFRRMQGVTKASNMKQTVRLSVELLTKDRSMDSKLKGPCPSGQLRWDAVLDDTTACLEAHALHDGISPGGQQLQVDESNQLGKGPGLSVSVHGMLAHATCRTYMPEYIQRHVNTLPMQTKLQEQFGAFDTHLLHLLEAWVPVHVLMGIVPLPDGQSAEHEVKAVRKLFATTGYHESDLRSMVGDGSSVNQGKSKGISTVLKLFFVWCLMHNNALSLKDMAVILEPVAPIFHILKRFTSLCNVNKRAFKSELQQARLAEGLPLKMPSRTGKGRMLDLCKNMETSCLTRFTSTTKPIKRFVETPNIFSRICARLATKKKAAAAAPASQSKTPTTRGTMQGKKRPAYASDNFAAALSIVERECPSLSPEQQVAMAFHRHSAATPAEEKEDQDEEFNPHTQSGCKWARLSIELASLDVIAVAHFVSKWHDNFVQPLADFEQVPVAIKVFYVGLVFHRKVTAMESAKSSLVTEYGLAHHMQAEAKEAVDAYLARFSCRTGAGAWLHAPEFMMASLLAPEASGYPHHVALRLCRMKPWREAEHDEATDVATPEALLSNPRVISEVKKLAANNKHQMSDSVKELIMWAYINNQLHSMFAESSFSMQKIAFLTAPAGSFGYSSREARRKMNPHIQIEESWIKSGGLLNQAYEAAKKRHPWRKNKE